MAFLISMVVIPVHASRFFMQLSGHEPPLHHQWPNAGSLVRGVNKLDAFPSLARYGVKITDASTPIHDLSDGPLLAETVEKRKRIPVTWSATDERDPSTASRGCTRTRMIDG